MKILILCNLIPNTASTVGDHISAFIKYSRHQFELFNCMKNRLSLEYLNQFDGVLIHYSILVEMDYYLSPINRYVLSQYRGLKMIFLQDENRNVDKLVNCIKNMNMDIIFTVVPAAEVEKVYPRALLPNVKIISVLTGFVQENLLNLATPNYQQRKLDVVYRSRKLSACFGRLCYEKYIIAEKFLIDAKKYNLAVDISVLESDRIYGQGWIDFLLSSKACLGVESGASLFDYTGEIRSHVERHELLHPDTSFDELEQLYFKGQDYNVHYNQISPRHFEAASLKTLMILYEGDYSGILIPWRHYVPLKKDHSNIQEVVDVLKNPNQWLEITNNAYQEVAQNKQYTFESFVKNFDAVVKQRCTEFPIRLSKINSAIDTDTSAPDSVQPSSGQSTQFTQSVFNKLLNLVMFSLNTIKITIRQTGAKIFWWLDKVSNNSANQSANNNKPSFIIKLLTLAKNKIKLLAIRTRDYDKANSKMLLLFSIIYYKFYFDKFALRYNQQNLVFCLHDHNHTDHKNNIANTTKVSYYDLIFKKINTCDNCRMFIGF